jgi:two-component system, OmpR family, sensor histidine kinase KdpD
MLRDARARQRSGADTVVAHWERHGRPATAAQLDDLEVPPARSVTYRGASFAELDVAAILDRRPELAVVDELAHANLPGEGHTRCWQDVDELLASAIDVYTTLNVANLESLGQVVSRITGVHPAEPVPDAFVRAGEITLVDLAPSALRHRLAQGLVFPQERVDAALSSYFLIANLAALQELTHLWLDDSVPDPVAAFTAAHGVSVPVQASSSCSAWPDHPRTNGSSVTPLISPGSPVPATGRSQPRSTGAGLLGTDGHRPRVAAKVEPYRTGREGLGLMS